MNQQFPWEERPRDSHDILWRYSANPLIGRDPIPRGARVFNSAVFPCGEGYAGVLRVDYRDGRPRLHMARSGDGFSWAIEEDPIPWTDEEGQPAMPHYAYDPRVTRIDDTWYICWCDDFPGASIGGGYTRDFKTFTRLPNLFMPFNRNAVLFPRKIGGKYKILTCPSDSGHTPFGDIILSESPDMIYWGNHKLVMTAGGKGWWQSMKIGAGAVPIETGEGWLLFYHGVTNTCNGYVYSLGAALLDRDDPSRVLYRSGDYLLTPQTDYETRGFVPNVIFPCSALVDGDRVAIYYGAADTDTALAFGRISEIIQYLKDNHEEF